MRKLGNRGIFGISLVIITLIILLLMSHANNNKQKYYDLMGYAETYDIKFEEPKYYTSNATLKETESFVEQTVIKIEEEIKTTEAKLTSLGTSFSNIESTNRIKYLNMLKEKLNINYETNEN